MNNYINKLSSLYIEQRNYLSGPLKSVVAENGFRAFFQTTEMSPQDMHLNKFLKRVSFGSKDCTKELKLGCAYFLSQTRHYLLQFSSKL